MTKQAAGAVDVAGIEPKEMSTGLSNIIKQMLSNISRS
jgi:hypothetical protein